MVDVLPADLLYPECPKCGVGIFAKKLENEAGKTGFHCEFCHIDYQAPRDSKWYGIDELDNELKKDYIGCEIRGMPYEKQAQISGRRTGMIIENVEEARRELQKLIGSRQTARKVTKA